MNGAVMLDVLTQVILPVALALMMFSMGLGLVANDFKRIAQHPKPVFLGVLLQLCLLPLVALALIVIVSLFYPLPSSWILGLLIIAACPGGATSNIISHLSGGDGALSISMTALVSVLVPFIIPFSLAYQFGLFGAEGVSIQLPIVKTMMQLFIVTVCPVFIAMLIRHVWTAKVVRIEPLVRKASTMLFLLLIVSLCIAQWPILQAMGTIPALLCSVMVLALCLMVMGVTAVIARMLKFDRRIEKTLAIEVGIQNAGTGIFIAALVLNDSRLVLIPLMYGLVMNLPIIVLIMNNLRKAKV